MKPPYPFKDIAKLTKLSTATVDRAWHQRPGHTARARIKVLNAIKTLETRYNSDGIRSGPSVVHVISSLSSRADLEFRELFEFHLDQIIQQPIEYCYNIEQFSHASKIDGAIQNALAENPDFLFIIAPHFGISTKNRRLIRRSDTKVVCLTRDNPELPAVIFCGFDDTADAAKAAFILSNFAIGRDNCIVVLEHSVETQEKFLATFIAKMTSYKPDVKIQFVAVNSLNADLWSTIEADNSFFLCRATPEKVPLFLIENEHLPICYVNDFGDQFKALLVKAKAAFTLAASISIVVPKMCQSVYSDYPYDRSHNILISRALEFP